MKQSKKIISLLMALVMVLTAVPITVFAYHSDYTVAGGYDSLDTPYVTPQQAASMLLDMVDAALAKNNLTIPVNIYVGSKTIDLRSIDQATTSITDFWNWGWVQTAFFLLNFGDIESMNMTYIQNCPKRTASGTTDLDVVIALCHFLADNYDRVGKLIDDTFNWGFVTTVTTLPDTVHHIPETLKAAVAKPLNGNVAPDPSVTIDSLVQKMVDGLVVGNLNPDTGKYDGLLPSMAGKTNLTSGSNSVYTLITNVINAGMGDIVVPMLAKLILGLAGVVFDADHPGGDDSHLGSLSMVIDAVTGMANITYTPEDLLTPLSKMTAALKYLLMGGGLVDYFVLDDTGLHISQKLIDTVDGLVRVALTLIPNMGFLKNTTVFKTQDEVMAMTIPECYAYLGRLLINEFLPFADIPDTATSFRAVLTYALIDLAKDVLPETDFETMIDAGTLNPDGDGFFIVAAPLMRYYLNGYLPVDIPTGLNFEQTLNFVVDWFFSKYGGLFDTSSFLPTDTVWQKIDKVLFNIIPLNWLPAQFTGSKYLVMNWLIGNILDFNYVGLASIVQRNPNSELNESVTQVLLNTVSRVLKGAVGGHTILPMNLTTLESIFTKVNLRATVENLSEYLYPNSTSLLGTLFPLVTQIMGMWTTATYVRKAPTGAPLVGIDALQSLLDSYTPRNLNANLQYYQAGYHFFGSEDFSELRTFNNYNNAKTEVQGLLDGYAANTDSLNLQSNTDAAYRVSYYFSKLNLRSSLCVTQLTKEIGKSFAADYLHAPANTYTAASYAAWLQAYNFAMDVRSKAIVNTPGIRQSEISAARQNLFKAVKGLRPFVPYADYTQLDNYITQAQNTLNTLPSGIYTADSIQALRDALSAAQGIDRFIAGADQATVDQVASDLYSAIYGLTYILPPAIDPTPNSAADIYGNHITPVVNTARKFIYGLSQGGFQTSNIFTQGGGVISIVATTQGKGTGTKIRLSFGGMVIATYTVIVFGDVNGDGNIDDGDSGMIVDVQNYFYNWTGNPDKRFAADVNGDGNIDSIDAGIVTDSLNYVKGINQITGRWFNA